MKHNIFHYIAVIVWYLLKDIIKSIIALLVGLIGFLIFQTKRTPYDILFGLPLALIGLGLLINYITSIFYSIFSPQFNKAECFLCASQSSQNTKAKFKK